MKVEKCGSCQWLKKCAEGGAVMDAHFGPAMIYTTFKTIEALKEYLDKVNACVVYEPVKARKSFFGR